MHIVLDNLNKITESMSYDARAQICTDYHGESIYLTQRHQTNSPRSNVPQPETGIFTFSVKKTIELTFPTSESKDRK